MAWKTNFFRKTSRNRREQMFLAAALFVMVILAFTFRNYVDVQNEEKPCRPYVKILADGRYSICSDGIIGEHCAQQTQARHSGDMTFSSQDYAYGSDTWKAWQSRYVAYGASTKPAK